MMTQRIVGNRVGAVLSSDDEMKEIQFLGWGSYAGEEVPVEAVGWLAETVVELGHTNPKIVLDSGEVVYGCECWWGKAETVERHFEKWRAEGWTVKEVSITKVRERHRAGSEA